MAIDGERFGRQCHLSMAEAGAEAHAAGAASTDRVASYLVHAIDWRDADNTLAALRRNQAFLFDRRRRA